MALRTNNIRAFASPSRYIQGTGVLNEIKDFTDKYGENIVFIIDAFLFDNMKVQIEKAYNGIGTLQFLSKGGEITLAAMEAVENQIANMDQVDVMVAVGGGKTIDTVKVIAEKREKPVIVVPTVASTDAPCSALSVIYKENGEHSHEIFLKKNPDLVLVDTKVIAEAPVRLLVSGMGDALATYFEAMANQNSNFDSVVAEEVGKSVGPSLAAKGIAKMCYDVLLEDGVKAKAAAELHMVTEALENIVEANTLLSGIGFESNGTAAAHSINDGLTVIPEAVKYFHGERVAFGVLCQLILENADQCVIDEVYEFCVNVGLPVTLEDVGVKDITQEQLMAVADSAYHNVIHAEPMVVTRESIASAIMVADRLGRSYKAR